MRSVNPIRNVIVAAAQLGAHVPIVLRITVLHTRHPEREILLVFNRLAIRRINL